VGGGGPGVGPGGRAPLARAEPSLPFGLVPVASRAGSFRLASWLASCVKLLNMYNIDGYWLIL
jgi:hypothetical protein